MPSALVLDPYPDKQDYPTLYALHHHAKPLLPVVKELCTGYITDLWHQGWKIEHRWTHCYSIRKGTTELHFRFGRDAWVIDVYDALPMNGGKVIFSLKREVDAARFIRKIRTW